MAKFTFWDVIETTIEKVGLPLSAKEIWEKAQELGTIGDLTTNGKTPWATIAAYCYTDINNNGDKSIIVQTSERPAQFYLRKLITKSDDIGKLQIQKDTETEKKEKEQEKKEKFDERSLHPLLVAFAHSHFKAYTKTVFHEGSTKASKGKNEWLHPDLVGVYFPFSHYNPETLSIQKHLSISSIKIYSFEMKIRLHFPNLRESFFQAVSNSSWANEGYIAAIEIDDDLKFRDELRRLNNAFGIGVILLNTENIFASDILFPSKISQEIDWDTVNRLASDNPGFRDLLKLIVEDCEVKRVKDKTVYDKILTPEDLDHYIQSKGIR